MKTGDIVIVRFPYSNLVEDKARPAVVVTETDDYHRDVLLCMISSVVPKNITPQQMLISPTIKNNLRALSIIKISRIVTVESEKVLTQIGKLDDHDLNNFKKIFKSLVDSDAE